MYKLYKRIWLLVIIALATATLGTTPPARGAGGNDTIAPQVIDTAPARGEELPIDGSVQFYFDQPMDHASVEATFKATISPAVPGTAPTSGAATGTTQPIAGSLNWPDDQTLVFKPSALLARSSEYTFSV